MDVNQGEAQELAARLEAEDPDRMTHRFVPRANPDGSWSIAKVLWPEQLRNRLLPTTTEVRPDRPSLDDDVRGGHERRVPGLPGGLAG